MSMSMTGFGRGFVEASWGRLVVDIQSVNRRYFEAMMHLPKEMMQYECEIRKWVAERILRGQVAVRIQFTPSPQSMETFFPSFELLQGAKSSLESLCRKLQLNAEQIDLRLVLESIPSTQKGGSFDDEAALKECVEKALSALCSMKREEGKALVSDLKKRLHILEGKLLEIEALAPEASSRAREKLVEKFTLVFGEGHSWDERLMKEAFLLAEKVDVTEEIVRLKSHFRQFEQCFHAEGMIGKKMDFVVQEMTREVNTIGSKSNETKISYLVVEMKSEIEKMREQVQNIE